MEKLSYYASIEGISLEHMVRYGKFDMRVKHFHNEYEIFYILEGKRSFFFNNRNFVASKGDLILIDTNLIHMTKSVSNDDSGHNRIILYLTPDRVQEFDSKYPTLHLTRFLHQHYGVYHLTQKQQDSFMDLYYLIKQEYNNKQRNYKQAIELAITSYFLYLTRELDVQVAETPQFPKEGKHQHVYEIADYLSQHYNEEISLEKLAEQFFLSKYYICRLFKEVTGYTIREYINVTRIQHAQQFLERTDYSISKIAEITGYGSTTHFEQTFKTYMTISPLKYRKNLDIVKPISPLINP